MSKANSLEKAILNYLDGVAVSEDIQRLHLCGAGAVCELEEKLKRHHRMKYAVCVSNATTGLLAVALALNLKQSDFITTPLTFGASIAGWLLLGNRPIFADIEPETLTLDPAAVQHAITPKTRAILVSDIFGNPHDMVSMRKIADDHGLCYIADAAQSLGATRDNLPSSSLADALVISFTAGKTVFAGEGGAVLTNNSDLYQKLIWFTQHTGRQKKELGLNVTNELALNARIHPMAALWANAVFLESLKALKSYQSECFAIIDLLNSIGLTEKIAFKEHNIAPSFFRLTAAWRAKPKPSKLIEELRYNGFSARLETLPVRLLYRQPAFIAQYQKNVKVVYNCPQAEKQIRKRFCLTKTAKERFIR